jgi:hypothetical protein
LNENTVARPATKHTPAANAAARARRQQGVVLRDNRDMLDFVRALGFGNALAPDSSDAR